MPGGSWRQGVDYPDEGDTLTAVADLKRVHRTTWAAGDHAGVAQDFSFVSTAGGAFLEWMEGRTLPGVAALQQQG